jgi:hypothetical protein
MKKRLLLVAFAMMSVMGSFAYEKDSYIYTSTQKFQFTGENIVKNGDFAEGLVGWKGSDGGELDPATWTLSEGSGPNGEHTVKSLAATEGAALCGVWGTEEGLVPGKNYLVSLQIKGADIQTTVGTKIDANYLDFFTNTDGALIRVDSKDEAPVTGIATAQVISADNWTTLCFLFTYEENTKVVMHLEKMATDMEITNITLQEAQQVYDDRIMKRTFAFANQLFEDANFNVAEAAEARENAMGAMGMILDMAEKGEMDDISGAEEMMNQFNGVMEEYLAVSSRNMADQLAGIEIAGLAEVKRGGNRPATYANLDLQGGNWGHPANTDYLMSAIQTGYSNSGSYNVFNQYFPAGKYFFTAEFRNANTNKTSWPCVHFFNLETTCRFFVGNDTVDIEGVKGEDYVRYYMIADIKEAGTFRAGIIWPGVSSGGSFFVRGTSVRAFNGEEIVEKIEHMKTFEAYKAQWDAAVSARNKMYEMVDQQNYIWGQDSLASARAIWDPVWFAQYEKYWVDADGNDTGVASTAELDEWRLYQGYTPCDVDSINKLHEFQLVRNYQWASNYVTNLNKPFTDLATAIDEAKKTRNMGAYSTGDRATYKTAIETAIATIKDVRAKTTDATRVADSTTLVNAQATLADATAAFIASVELKPFVDIDFANVAQQDAETQLYYILGASGRIDFSTFDAENTGNTSFCQGKDDVLTDVLRVGNGSGTVTLTEEQIPTDGDNFRATFDVWLGNLSGKNFYFDFRNANDERIAGFSINRYNGSLAYNEFDSQLTSGGKGMDVLKYASGVGKSGVDNASICVDNNLSQFDLVINYGKGTVQGTLKNAKNGTCEGEVQAINATLADNKVAKVVVGSNYNNADRRCWFDNLKLFKYQAVDFEEDITENGWAEWSPVVDGIATVKENNKFDNTIYTLSGVRVNSKNLQKGLYIINGKKYVVK